jgi:hypothetical protein
LRINLHASKVREDFMAFSQAKKKKQDLVAYEELRK